MNRLAIHHRRRRRPVRGVAAVEFAVCLPVIVLLVFGAIEASSFIFLKQSLNVAAYEGIRESIRVGFDNANGMDRASNILDSRNVNDFAVSFPNGEAGNAVRGDEIVIEVTAPTSTNSPLAGQFVSNRLLTARVVMVKE
ncbi:MAG: TadE/TadG family type IV pilus assembly protein [Rubripirellula sp.]